MNKNNLKNYKEGLEKKDKLEKRLKEKRREFDCQNMKLIDEARESGIDLAYLKTTIEEEAKQEFEKNGKKKLEGGIGIRETIDLIYEKKNAFRWAREHNLCISLDQKEFERIAKIQEFDFVLKQEKIIVTFPKEIILEEEN